MVASRLWAAPEQYLLDVGRQGELAVARLRLVGVTIVVGITLGNTVFSRTASEFRSQSITVLAAAFGFLIAVGLWFLVRRGQFRSGMAVFTSLMDVSLITLGCVALAVLNDPHQALRSPVIVPLYIIALLLACFRFDVRVALTSGLASLVQYSLFVAFAVTAFDLDSERYAPHPYGLFRWTEQFSKLALIGLSTYLAVMMVQRSMDLRRSSTFDRLTGLFNRAYAEEYLATEFERSKRHKRWFTIALADIDRFKQFNDRFGHATGDRALQTVARAIQGRVRASDLVARYGGEEILIIFPETGCLDAVLRVEAIRADLDTRRFDTLEGPMPITLSAGVASWPDDGADVAQVIAVADRRLLEAKNAGRNCVVGSQG